MKRKIMILTIAFLSSVLMCANVFAAASGRCGDSITWTLDDSGNLTLSGSGEMWNYGIVTSPFKDYGIKTVTIGDGITSIGDYAFYSCRGLTELTLPNSVTSIGWYAFQGCTGLTELTLPNSVTSIGGCAFEGCNGLTELTLPNTLERIVASAFRGCSGLTELTLPSSVTRIGKNAFSDCSGLEKIISLAEIPPVCGSGGVFYGVNKTNCELIVPVISVIAYKLAEVWNEFSNISGFSGVEDTVADGNTIRVIGNQIEISGYFTSVEVYGVNGTLIYKGKDNVVTVPSAGIYLVHMAGKTRKIVVE
jgi:cell surface protein